MPYQPYVQDHSGAYKAAGISEAGRAIAEGIRDYNRNKVMASQAIGRFEGMAGANPDMLEALTQSAAPEEGQQPRSVGPDVAKAYAKLQKDGALGVRDAALLAQFADSFSKEKQQMQERAYQQAQAQHMQAMAQQQAVMTERMRAQKAEDDRVRNLLGNFSQGVGNGVYSADVQNNPYLKNAAQLRQVSGASPSPDNLLDYASRTDANVIKAAQAQAAAAAAAEKADIATQRLAIAQQRADQKYADGTEGEIVINKIPRKIVWASGKPHDKETMLPLYVENRDMMGNATTGVPNPVLFGKMDEGTGGMPFGDQQYKGIQKFSSEVDAMKAYTSGKLKIGDSIEIGGKPGKWK